MAHAAARGVFISYARHDGEIVSLAAKLLRAGGATVFQDVVNVEYGARWQDELMNAIRRCERVLVFWSAAASASEWVEREWRAALAVGKRIVPMLLDQTPLPEALAGFNGMPDLMRLLIASQPTPIAMACRRMSEAPVPVPAAPRRSLWWAGAGVGSFAVLTLIVVFGVWPHVLPVTGSIPSVTPPASGVASPASAPDAVNGAPGGLPWELAAVAIAFVVLVLLMLRAHRRRARANREPEVVPARYANRPPRDSVGAEFVRILFS